VPLGVGIGLAGRAADDTAGEGEGEDGGKEEEGAVHGTALVVLVVFRVAAQRRALRL
jgi:hypothetical protein